MFVCQQFFKYTQTCVQRSPLEIARSPLYTGQLSLNFAEHIRQLKILGSCPVTVKYRVIALYSDVI